MNGPSDPGAQAAEMAAAVGDKAEQAGDSTSLEVLACAGLVAYGAVHLLIGWLASQIAWGTTAGDSADTCGAMNTLAEQPFGRILLWLVAVGLVALALWQAGEGIWGSPPRWHRADPQAARLRGQGGRLRRAGSQRGVGRTRFRIIELRVPAAGHLGGAGLAGRAR